MGREECGGGGGGGPPRPRLMDYGVRAIAVVPRSQRLGSSGQTPGRVEGSGSSRVEGSDLPGWVLRHLAGRGVSGLVQSITKG